MSRRNGGIIGPTNTPVGGLMTGVAGGVWRMNDVLTFVSNNQWPSGPQNIDNSCRFEDGNNDYLVKTFVTPTNQYKYTISMWVKRSLLGSNQTLFGVGDDGSNNATLKFTSDDQIQIYDHIGGVDKLQKKTNMLFRDTSAWYHIFVSSDRSISSPSTLIYINGVQVTSFAANTEYSQNDSGKFNTAVNHYLGVYTNNSEKLSGYIAEAVFVDGLALAHTDFGETDSTTGIWKPKKIGRVGDVGNNTFYLDFKDSSSLGNDASGKNNDFTATNLTSVDQGTDTCVVNYATMNSLAVPPSNAPTFAEGNLKISTDTSNANPIISTMGVSQGKWYAEAKRISYDGGSGDDDGFRIGFGVTYVEDVNLVPPAISNSGHYFMIGTGTVYNGSTDLGDKAGDSNISDNGVVGIALDLDNNRISWAFNGAWMTGSNAWSGSSPSSYVTIESGKTYFFLQTDGSSGRAYTAGWNFGGQSAFTISSGNSDANGFGNFEYPVPSGYYALNTSNLNTYG
mgnify:CR=1 FL=1